MWRAIINFETEEQSENIDDSSLLLVLKDRGASVMMGYLTQSRRSYYLEIQF